MVSTVSTRLAPTAPPAEQRGDLLRALLLGAAAAAPYLPALSLGFFSDDFYFLGRNAPILERPLFLFHIFYRDFIPLVHLSFVGDWLLAGDRPALYHATSILIHMVTTALLFLLIRSLGGGRVTAAGVTLLWALNPHISEAVIWTAARGHSLATLFLVATLVVLRRTGRLLSGLALALLALGAKETALFPLVLAPLLHRERRIWWPAVWLFAPLCVAFAVFNLVAKPHLHLARATLPELILQGPFLLLRPLGLDRFYDYSPAAAVAVYLLLVVMTVFLREHPCARIGSGWLLLSLIPIVVQPVYSSRYFYLLSVGYALLGCALLDTLRSHLVSAPGRRLAVAGGAVLSVLLAAADVVHIGREIGDYRLLCAPYMRAVELATPQLRALEMGDTLAVLDLSPRRSIHELNAVIAERGTLEKLIPFRPQGLDGTVELADLANTVRPRRPGELAYPGNLSEDPITHWLIYDGRTLVEPAAELTTMPPRNRILVVAVGPAHTYFARLNAAQPPH